jgi:chromosome segregation ATPase
MTVSPRKTLLQLCHDTTTDEWLLVLQALQATFHWCEEVGTSVALQDRVNALRYLVELEAALQTGNSCLAHVPDIIATAIPGQTIEKNLAQQTAQLEQNAKELKHLRSMIAGWEEQEETLQAQVVESQALRERLAELERLSQLAAGVDELRKQVTVAEEHRTAAEQEVEQLEVSLHQDAHKLVTLSEQHLTQVHHQIQDWLAEAERYEDELRRTMQQWHAASERYQELEALLAEHTEVLRLYMEADQIVAEALGSTSADALHARQMLERVQQFLDQADTLLRKALAANAAAQKVQHFTVGKGTA